MIAEGLGLRRFSLGPLEGDGDRRPDVEVGELGGGTSVPLTAGGRRDMLGDAAGTEIEDCEGDGGTPNEFAEDGVLALAGNRRVVGGGPLD